MISGMTTEQVRKFLVDGFQPAVLLESGPDLGNSTSPKGWPNSVPHRSEIDSELYFDELVRRRARLRLPSLTNP